MLRALTLTVLLATIGQHLAPTPCSASDRTGEEHGTAPVSEHSGHEEPAGQPDHESHTDSAPDCLASMVCHASMVEGTMVGDIIPLTVPPAVHSRIPAEAPVAPVLTDEPPPPRRQA